MIKTSVSINFSSQYPEAYKSAVESVVANVKSLDEEEEEVKSSETKISSKMVATVSTETLKPTDKKEQADKVNIMKKTSSSSDTESASSGDDSSTDTG